MKFRRTNLEPRAAFSFVFLPTGCSWHMSEAVKMMHGTPQVICDQETVFFRTVLLHLTSFLLC